MQPQSNHREILSPWLRKYGNYKISQFFRFSGQRRPRTGYVPEQVNDFKIGLSDTFTKCTSKLTGKSNFSGYLKAERK